MTQQSDEFFERTVQGTSDPPSRHQFLLRPSLLQQLILFFLGSCSWYWEKINKLLCSTLYLFILYIYSIYNFIYYSFFWVFHFFVFSFFVIAFFVIFPFLSNESTTPEYIFSQFEPKKKFPIYFTFICQKKRNSLFFFVPALKWNTILNNSRLEIKKSLSHICSPSHCRNKKIGSIDMEIFGTWNHDLM